MMVRLKTIFNFNIKFHIKKRASYIEYLPTFTANELQVRLQLYQRHNSCVEMIHFINLLAMCHRA